jgi:hypothetical protein
MSIGEKKFYEAAKIKRVRAHLDEIPEDCGYEKKFRYNIDMNSNGIMGKWGWWFENKNLYDEKWHNWEEQDAYMSFEKKRDATMFWLCVGAENMGNR